MQAHYAKERFWNAALNVGLDGGSACIDIDRLRESMATDWCHMSHTIMPPPPLPPTSNASYANGVTADLGICVGTRNIDAVTDRDDYDFNHRINNWYNNMDAMKEMCESHLWAANKGYANKHFCINDNVNAYDRHMLGDGMSVPLPPPAPPASCYHQSMLDYYSMPTNYQSSAMPPPPPPPVVPSSLPNHALLDHLVPYQSHHFVPYQSHHLLPFIASDMKSMDPIAIAMKTASLPSMINQRPQNAASLVKHRQRSSLPPSESTKMTKTTASIAPTAKTSIDCNSDIISSTTVLSSSPSSTLPITTALTNNDTVRNVFQHYYIHNGHVANPHPKRKWTINYMMSKYNINTHYCMIYIYFHVLFFHIHIHISLYSIELCRA